MAIDVLLIPNGHSTEIPDTHWQLQSTNLLTTNSYSGIYSSTRGNKFPLVLLLTDRSIERIFTPWKRYTRKYSLVRYFRCKITLGCTCSILSFLSTILVNCDDAIHVVFTVYTKVFDFYRVVCVPSPKLSGNFACLNFMVVKLRKSFFLFLCRYRFRGKFI